MHMDSHRDRIPEQVGTSSTAGDGTAAISVSNCYNTASSPLLLTSDSSFSVAPLGA